MPPRKRKIETRKYQISAQRGLTSRFDDAYNAPEAARIATRRAREGWRVEVNTYSGRGYEIGRRTVHMTCVPLAKGAKTIAVCKLKPAFKKRVKGR